MRTVGIIGGIGPESTIEYYRRLIAGYRERTGDGSYPSIIINSVNMKKLLDLVAANQLQELAGCLLAELNKLARAGADFALLAANTPHVVFSEIERQSPVPLISIVQAAADAAKALGLKKLGLFGTRFTMQGSFYPEVFSRSAIALAAPDGVEQAYIHEKYFGELVNGHVLPGTRKQLLKIVDALKEREHIDGLILGGTELSLVFRENTARGIPVLDTTQIHVQAALARMLA